MMTIKTIIDRICDFSKAEDVFATPPFFVGFSGGPDSTALTLAVHALDRPFKAIHFNHGLRGDEAAADEAWCQQFCERRNIPFEAISLNVPENKNADESVEMAARRLRLDYWKTVQGTVLLGHHLNDALETFLLRMCRGGNTSSLTGLRPVSKVSGVRLARPLLCLSRKDVLEFVADHEVTACHDSTNDDIDIHRNLIRNRVVPALESVAGGGEALFKSLQFTAEDADCLDAMADHVDIEVSTATLRELPWPIAYRVLRNWFYAQPILPSPTLTGHCAQRIRHALNATSPVMIDVDDAWFLQLAGAQPLAFVSKEPSAFTSAIRWNWRNQPVLEIPQLNLRLTAQESLTDEEAHATFEDFSADELSDTLIVRPRIPGDVMVPFGSNSPKKLKKLISDAKLPIHVRASVIVLTTDIGEIIWVPDVRRAEIGRIGDGSKHIVRLRLEKLNHPPGF